MEMIADILLVAGALGAGLYCYVLARRLSRFNDLENGVGGAVAVLSAQVDDLSKTLNGAKAAASSSSDSLENLTERAEAVSRKLELLLASLHDIQEPPETTTRPEAETKTPAGPVFTRHMHDASEGH